MATQHAAHALLRVTRVLRAPPPCPAAVTRRQCHTPSTTKPLSPPAWCCPGVTRRRRRVRAVAVTAEAAAAAGAGGGAGGGRVVRQVLAGPQRTKLDEASDRGFYAFPRLVKHVDDGFLAQVTELYRQRIPPGAWAPRGVCVLAATGAISISVPCNAAAWASAAPVHPHTPHASPPPPLATHTHTAAPRARTRCHGAGPDEQLGVPPAAGRALRQGRRARHERSGARAQQPAGQLLGQGPERGARRLGDGGRQRGRGDVLRQVCLFCVCVFGGGGRGGLAEWARGVMARRVSSTQHYARRGAHTSTGHAPAPTLGTPLAPLSLLTPLPHARAVCSTCSSRSASLQRSTGCSSRAGWSSSPSPTGCSTKRRVSTLLQLGVQQPAAT
jgi:hypothetical protein